MAVDNITPWQATLTPEQLKEVTRKAGKASGEKRHQRVILRNYLEELLKIKTETGDIATDMSLALIQKALNGDVSAYNSIRDTMGQKPKEEVELSALDTINIKIDG